MGEQSLTITKGVAAVFIVLSLSGAPVFLRDSLSQFSLPLLMLCTGYSLSNSKHENADTFLGASVRTIYWPFWCWSLFFLVTHNLFSWLHIVNAPHIAAMISSRDFGTSRFVCRTSTGNSQCYFGFSGPSSLQACSNSSASNYSGTSVRQIP